MLLWLALLSCTVAPPGPATPGSASAAHAAKAAALADQAAAVEALAFELEQEVDRARDRVAEGVTTREEETAKLRALVGRVEAENTALQAAVKAWEDELPRLAGDPMLDDLPTAKDPDG